MIKIEPKNLPDSVICQKCSVTFNLNEQVKRYISRHASDWIQHLTKEKQIDINGYGLFFNLKECKNCIMDNYLHAIVFLKLKHLENKKQKYTIEIKIVN